MRAEVTAPLYRGFEQILEGRPPLEALALARRICGICSVSQSLAAAAALRDAMAAEVAPNGIVATNVAHATENAADGRGRLETGEISPQIDDMQSARRFRRNPEDRRHHKPGLGNLIGDRV